MRCCCGLTSAQVRHEARSRHIPDLKLTPRECDRIGGGGDW